VNIFLRGDRAVPMIIAKRFVKTEPKITKTRKFVGFKQGLGTLIYKTIELVQDCFWDVEQDVEDAGESDVVHYAIDVMDDPGAGAPELVVTKLHGKARPGCGVYCEVISPHPVDPEGGEDLHPYAPKPSESGARMIQPKKRRPVPLPPPERR
jgi:hypothetical protein